MEKKLERKIQTSGLELKNFSLFAFLIISSVFVIGFDNVYGHGMGSEIFPPVDLNGKQVSLEVSSSKNDPNESDDQQISISLIDFDSKTTLRDVIFQIKSERGEEFLFEQEFKADNGFIVFNFVSEETDSIIIEEENGGGLFDSLLGLESRLVNVKGPKLSEGGLYKLDVSVLSVDGYSQKLDEPLVFNAGISIAQTSKHDFIDPNFGEQNIKVVTFYDEISNFNYDSNSKEISFFMPFEWSQSNINQTSVVHEELIIPRNFGDLLVSGFTISVNGVPLSKDVVNIDDFFSDERLVHFIIFQKELQRIFDNNLNQNGMNFVIKPDKNYAHFSAVTDNGQFRIFMSSEPENLKSNSNAKMLFDITDIFLKNKPVATNYEFSVTQDERILYEQSGMSTDSKDEHNVAQFLIPADISGIVNFNFKNLDGNKLAKTTFPVVIDRITFDESIPDWIKNSAKWWANGEIDDDSFVKAIQYLIEKDILKIPQTLQGTSSGSNDIPGWIKSNASWWADGSIDDKTFVQAIQYLINNGILQI